MGLVHHTRPIRRGVTLIEMLVVIGILLVLAMVAVPQLRPNMANQRTREAARTLGVALASAQTQAALTGRPVGVQLIRDTQANSPNVCTIMHQVETPPPYAGDVASSTIVCVAGGASDPAWMRVVSFPAGDDPFTRKLVLAGDTLQVNFQGHRYRIDSVAAGATSGTWRVLFSSQTAISPPTVASPGLPYQFFRQPIRSTLPIVSLPAQAAIDLAFSGSSDSVSFTAPVPPGTPSHVTIMFSPSGALDSYFVDGTQYRFREDIFLLIGARDRVPTDLDPAVFTAATYRSFAEDGKLNYQDMNNLWVVIGAQSGLVITEKLNDVSVSTPPVPLTDWKTTRQLARERQSLGGR